MFKILQYTFLGIYSAIMKMWFSALEVLEIPIPSLLLELRFNDSRRNASGNQFNRIFSFGLS